MLLSRGMRHFREACVTFTGNVPLSWNMCYFHGECATFVGICATSTGNVPLS